MREKGNRQGDAKSGIYTVGALVRGHFRRACMELGLRYEEDKGFLDSGFMVEGSIESIVQLDNWIRKTGSITATQ